MRKGRGRGRQRERDVELGGLEWTQWRERSKEGKTKMGKPGRVGSGLEAGGRMGRWLEKTDAEGDEEPRGKAAGVERWGWIANQKAKRGKEVWAKQKETPEPERG